VGAIRHLNRHLSWPAFKSNETVAGMQGSVEAKYVVKSTRTTGRWSARTFMGRVVESVGVDGGHKMSILWSNGECGSIQLSRGKNNKIKFRDVSGCADWVLKKNRVRMKLYPKPPVNPRVQKKVCVSVCVCVCVHVIICV
jgi:hypothetical protein